DRKVLLVVLGEPEHLVLLPGRQGLPGGLARFPDAAGLLVRRERSSPGEQSGRRDIPELHSDSLLTWSLRGRPRSRPPCRRRRWWRAGSRAFPGHSWRSRSG